MQRRAESASETRQRLVEATAALHYERGVQATTLRDIAERAAVSVGTAYHHFPSYDDAIRACGHYTQQLNPLPDRGLFDGIESRVERVAAFVRAIGAYCERCPWIEGIRADRDRYQPIAEGIGALEDGIETLARLALGSATATRGSRIHPAQAGGARRPKRGSRAASLSALLAFTDPAVFRVLRQRGMSLQDSCATVTAAILASLPPTTARRNRRKSNPSPARSTS